MFPESRVVQVFFQVAFEGDVSTNTLPIAFPHYHTYVKLTERYRFFPLQPLFVRGPIYSAKNPAYQKTLI